MTQYRREAVLCTAPGLTAVLHTYRQWRLVGMTYAPVYCQYTLIFEQEEE